MPKTADTEQQPQRADKSALLSARPEITRDVTIDGFGEITVRGLTRSEALSHGETADKKGLAHAEALMIATCCIDPTFTIEEVKRWQKISAAGEMEPLSDAIQQLSALEEGAGKEATERFPDE